MFDFRLFLLIFIFLLSYKISGTQIFLHQKISLVFSALGLILVCISTILLYHYDNSDNKEDYWWNNWWFLNLVGIVCSILYVLQMIGFKYDGEIIRFSVFITFYYRINFIFF